MRHLNYNHLQYFWTVAREGSIARAAEVLHLTPQTISGQLKLLEESIGHDLFERVGRRLVLTEMGRVVREYADDIFNTGAELASVVRGNRIHHHRALSVGIVNSIPKLIAERILAPAIPRDGDLRLSCEESSLHQLLAELAVHKLDLVLSDQPVPQGLGLKAYNHLLGASTLSVFGKPDLVETLRPAFPESLDAAPLLLPSTASALRRRIDEHFEHLGVAPRVVAEFDDSALMKAFGEAGLGLFVAPSVISEEVCRMYRVELLGQLDGIEERFYAISAERRLKHEAVVRVTEIARRDLFPNGS